MFSKKLNQHKNLTALAFDSRWTTQKCVALETHVGHVSRAATNRVTRIYLIKLLPPVWKFSYCGIRILGACFLPREFIIRRAAHPRGAGGWEDPNSPASIRISCSFLRLFALYLIDSLVYDPIRILIVA